MVGQGQPGPVGRLALAWKRRQRNGQRTDQSRVEHVHPVRGRDEGRPWPEDSLLWSMRMLLIVARVMRPLWSRIAEMAAARMRWERLPIMPPVRWWRYFAIVTKVVGSCRWRRRPATTTAGTAAAAYPEKTEAPHRMPGDD